MPLCPTGTAYRDEIRLRGLDAELLRIVELIRSTIFERAEFANPSTELVVPPGAQAGESGVLVIPPQVRVADLRESDLLSLEPGATPGALRGLYHSGFGKILLCRDRWCIKTFAHEALHSVSVFGRRIELGRALRPLVEGLTEFYVGYLLSRAGRKSYRECYDQCWIENQQSMCYHSYHPPVAMWAAFCCCIPMKETQRIYFYDGSLDWESRWREFIQAIRDRGHTGFRDILQTRTPLSSWLRFHEECMRGIGHEYDIAYASMQNCVDLDKIKVGHSIVQA